MLKTQETNDCELMPLAFDEAGRPVVVTHPVYYDDHGGQPSDPRGEIDPEQLLICLLTRAKNCSEVGERAMVLAYIMQVEGGPTTLRALGAALGVSHTGALKAVSRLKADFLREMTKSGLFGFQSPHR